MTSPSADIRQALITNAAVIAQVADRVVLNAANESTALPYVVYRVDRNQQRGLDGSLHGEIITAEIQAWARGALRCELIADAIQDALTAMDGAMVTDRTTGLDPETLLDYESVRVSILR